MRVNYIKQAGFLAVYPLITLPLIIIANVTLFDIGIIISLIFFIHTFILIIKRQIKLNFFSLLSFALLIGYGFGSFTTLFTANEIVNTVQYTDKFSKSLWLTITSSFVLIFISSFCTPIDDYIHKKKDTGLPQRNNFFYIVVLSFIALTYATGGLSFSGVQSIGNTLSILGSIAYSFALILPALLLEDVFEENKRKERIVHITLLAITFIFILPLGRRPFLFAILMPIIWMSLRILHLKLNKFKILLLISILSFGVVSSNYIFLAFRVTSGDYVGISNASMLDRITDSNDLLQKDGISEINNWLREQNSDRAFVLRFFSDLVDAESKKAPMYGTEIFESLKIITPKFFGVEKYQGDIENFAQRHFDLVEADEANSILTTGISDFGLPGVFIMPIFIASLFQFYCKFITKVKFLPYFAKRILTFLLVFQMLNCEIVLATYLVTIRDSILIACIIIIILKIINVFNINKKTYIN